MPFASVASLRSIGPERSTTTGRAPTIPSAMRWTLIASVSAAVLSAAVALHVALRDAGDEPAVATDGAAVAHSPEPREPEPEPAPEPNPRAAEPDPSAEPATLPWPDTQLSTLPPVGAAPRAMGQSVGSPRDGALLRPTQMPPGRGYVIRSPQTAWGTANTIEHLRAAIETVHAAHPTVHQLVIGDISSRRGGPLWGHQSHQAGRDVDIGLLYRASAEEPGPTEFIEGSSKNLDRRATYDLIAALAASADEPDGVELIVLDYNLQRVLRRFAEARGVPQAELDALFQFPHGPNARHGLVRHMPAHRDHLHVRFRCPKGDAYCRDPLIGFGGMEAPEGPLTGPPGI